MRAKAVFVVRLSGCMFSVALLPLLSLLQSFVLGFARVAGAMVFVGVVFFFVVMPRVLLLQLEEVGDTMVVRPQVSSRVGSKLRSRTS